MLRNFGLVLTIMTLLLMSLAYAVPAQSHEPIFMISPEAPGKGAFDIHTEITHERQGDERRFELEQEFLIVIPGAKEPEAYSIGERVRSAIGETAFFVDGSKIRVTVSQGVVNYNLHWRC